MATPAPTSAKDADTLRKAIVAPTGVALIGRLCGYHQRPPPARCAICVGTAIRV